MNEEKYITREELKEYLSIQNKEIDDRLEKHYDKTFAMLREAITVISDRMTKRTESFEKNIEKLLEENNLILKKLGMHDDKFKNISKITGED